MPLQDFIEKTGGKKRREALSVEEIKARFRAHAMAHKRRDKKPRRKER